MCDTGTFIHTNIQFLMFLFFVLHHLCFVETFKGSEIQHGIFCGLTFGPGIFWGTLEAPGIFLGFDLCPLRSSRHFRSTPPPTPRDYSSVQYDTIIKGQWHRWRWLSDDFTVNPFAFWRLNNSRIQWDLQNQKNNNNNNNLSLPGFNFEFSNTKLHYLPVRL